MIWCNCSPAGKTNGRLYGGAGSASSAEAEGRHVTAPSLLPLLCHTPLKVALGTRPEGKRGGRLAIGVAPSASLEASMGPPPPWALWRRSPGAGRFSRSFARLSKTAARSRPKAHGLRKYLGPPTSEGGANIKVPERFSRWMVSYILCKAWNYCDRGAIWAGQGRPGNLLCCAARQWLDLKKQRLKYGRAHRAARLAPRRYNSCG